MRKPDVTIRQCACQDLSALRKLYGQLHTEDTSTDEEIRNGFEAMMQFPGCQIFVAEIDAQVTGTFALYILPNMTRKGRPAAVLENIVVDQQRRGQGIGRAMLEKAKELAEQAGCYKLSLTSNAQRDEAHTFYERCGLVRHGISFRYTL